MVLFRLLMITSCSQDDGDSVADTGSPPEGQVVTIAPAPESPTLLINEVLPDFDSSAAGDLASSGDWFELLNIGTEPISWAELYFEVGSNISPSGFGAQACTAGTIEPMAHPVITAGRGDNGLGDCMIPSPLEMSEETIIVWQLQATKGGTVATPISAVQWRDQLELPYSAARIPDGSQTFVGDAVPTPGFSNDP